MSTQGVRRVEYLQLVSHPRREIDAKLWAIYQFLEAPEGTREPDKLIQDAAFLFLLPGVEQASFVANDLFSICVSFLDQKGMWLTDEKPRLIRLAMNPPPFTGAALMANLNYYPPIPITGQIDHERLIEKCKMVAVNQKKPNGLGSQDGGNSTQPRILENYEGRVQDVSPSTPLRRYNSPLREFDEAAKMRLQVEESGQRMLSSEAQPLRAATTPTGILAVESKNAEAEAEAEKNHDVAKATKIPTTGHGHSLNINCVQCHSKDVVDLGANAHGLHFYQCNNCKRCFRNESVQPKISHEKIASKPLILCPLCYKSDYRKSGLGGGVQRYFCKQCQKHFIPGKVKKRKNGATKGMKDEDDVERKKTQKKTEGLLKQADSDECQGGPNEELLEVEHSKSITQQVKELNSLFDEKFCNQCSGKLIQLSQLGQETGILTCNKCYCRFDNSLAGNDNDFVKGSEQLFKGQEKIISLLRGANEEINRSVMQNDYDEFQGKMRVLRDRLEEKRASILVKLNALWNDTDDVATDVVHERVKTVKTGEQSVANPFQEAILLLRRETPILEQSVTRLMQSHTQFSLSSVNDTRELKDSEKCEASCKRDNETFQHVSLTEPYDRNATESNDCYKLASRVVQDDGEEIEIYERCDDS
eukprot:CCRYP_005688-RA/>CCRYP_005688-RA protein AED:0.03 eAED:0.03 QI:102/1/1/1/1/1/2/1096/644